MAATIIEEMLGKTIAEIRGNKGGEQLLFLTDNECFKFWHEQDCCESVWIEDIVGDLSDLIGEPLLMAEFVTEHTNDDPHADSKTWTFYKFATRKGYVDIRWEGSSNGYYSEEVDYVNFQINRNLNIEKVEMKVRCTWDAAKLLAFTTNIDGKTDWRLPTNIEWGTLYMESKSGSGWVHEPYTWIYNGDFMPEDSSHHKDREEYVILVRDIYHEL